MKKSKLSLCLASSFVAALSLAACNSVKSNDSAIVTIKDYDGKEVGLLTDSVYNKYKEDSDGISKFYNAILESLIRYEYANPSSAIRDLSKSHWTKAIKSNSEIKSEAENNVKNDKNTAKENAETNDTSYETEWNAILKSHNCEDEDELLQYYIYQLEKEDITDKFFLLQKDSTLLTEWIGVTDEGKDAGGDAKGVFPYHIRHVLASISGGNTNFYDGTITADEAKNLGTIAKSLASTDFKFADVARKYSGDTGSGEKGGDVGIMATTTSFVNEFKLGIYAFDAIYNPEHKDDDAGSVIKAGLGIDDNYKLDVYKDGTTKRGIESAWKNGVNGGSIQTVPYGVFEFIAKEAETTKDSSNKQVNSGNEHFYPRNVMYNYYLNFHNPFVITKNDIDSTTGLALEAEDTDLPALRFQKTIGDKKVLTDEDGNVIIGCRSEHGIHFMIMEKSIYDYKEGGTDKAEPSLEEYYTSLVPSDDDYPYSLDGDGNKVKKDTYVSFIQTTDNTTYTTRAGEVKNAVKSFDSTYDYRLYEYILTLEKDKITIKDAGLATAIDEYISRTRETNLDSANKSLNEAWRTYTELVALQYENRTAWDDVEKTNEPYRTIHPRCAIGFKSHTGDAWAKPDSLGNVGVCYYEE
ncbi:MAG: peptidylprolyl isomerase [Bacilli bacterium]|nr:peptidylprolyl isomerase [Bacilli bacterium]